MPSYTLFALSLLFAATGVALIMSAPNEKEIPKESGPPEQDYCKSKLNFYKRVAMLREESRKFLLNFFKRSIYQRFS